MVIVNEKLLNLETSSVLSILLLIYVLEEKQKNLRFYKDGETEK